MTVKSADIKNAINADWWFAHHQHEAGIFLTQAEAEAALAAAPSEIGVDCKAWAAGRVVGQFAAGVEQDDVEMVESSVAAGLSVDIDSPAALLGWINGWRYGYMAV